MTNHELIKLVDDTIKALAKSSTEDNCFFRESDIVWTLQKQLIEALKDTDYKVFHEYPVSPLVPLKMSIGKMNELVEHFDQTAWLIKNYTLEQSAFYLKNEPDFNELNSGFAELREKGAKFEAIYTDLAIVKPEEGRTDLETKPEVIIELKYEPDLKNRRGKDFRNNRSERINSPKDIENDIRSLERCLEHPEIKCGIFVFIDEANQFSELLENNDMHDYGNRVWVCKKA